jgi:hypothetical protein
MIGLL